MIKNVLFDFGNVFVYWDPYVAFSDEYSRTEVDQFFEAVKWRELIERWDSGESHADTLAFLEAQDKEKNSSWAKMYQHYLPHFNLTLKDKVPGMFEIVHDLKANGIRVFGLTNWAYEDIAIAIEEVPAIAEMEGIVVSGYEKITKPDPAIFQIAIDRFALNPEETVFIDDRADNVETSIKLGFVGLQFYEGEDEAKAVGVLGPQIAPADQQLHPGLGAERFRKKLQELNAL
jgi:2-haloacid dehalogenase